VAKFRIEVVVDPRKAQAGAQKVERSLGGVERRATSLRSTLVAAFAAAGITAGLTSSVRLLADFSQEMSTVQAISQATGDEFAALEQRALDLGTTTRFSASQAAQGMVELARAGFDANEVFGSVEGTLKLAQAGALELSSAADIATNVLTGFGLEVAEISRVVDVLALGANSANTDVRGFGEALKFVAPVAAGLGVSLEETAAAVQGLANAGIKAGLAGRGLRAIFAELQSPGEKLAEVLELSGRNADEFSITAAGGLLPALQELRDAGVDASNVFDLLENSAATAFLALTGQADDLPGLVANLEGAEGAADRIAAIMDDNLNGALLAVRSAYEGLILSLGKSGGLDLLEEGARSLASGLRFLTENIDTTAKVAQALAIGTIVGVVIPALGSLAVALLTNPITLLPALLAGSIGALIAFREEIANLEVGGVRVGDVLQAAFDLVSERVSFLFDLFRDGVRFAVQVFGPGVRLALNEIGEAVSVLASFFLDNYVGSIDDAGAATKAFANSTIGLFLSIGQAISRFFTLARDQLTAIADFDLSSPIESARRLLLASSADLSSAFDGVTTDFRENFGRDYVGAALDIGKDAAANLFEGFRGLEGGDALRAFLDLEGDFNEKLAAIEGERVGAAFAAAAKQAASVAAAALVGVSLAGPADAFAGSSDAGGAGAVAAASAPSDDSALSGQNKLTERQIELLRAVQDPMKEIMALQADLNALWAAGAISVDEYNRAQLELTAQTGGVKGGLAEIRLGLEDVSGFVQGATVDAFNEGKAALLDFFKSGEFNADRFVESILDSLLELATNQLLLSLFGEQGGPGGGGGGGGFDIGGFISGFFAEGGRPPVGEPAVVGEGGAELFVPDQPGTIVPAGRTAALLNAGPQPAPQVNVTVPPAQVVVVDDPSRVLDVMRSRDGQEAQLSNAQENREALRGTLAT